MRPETLRAIFTLIANEAPGAVNVRSSIFTWQGNDVHGQRLMKIKWRSDEVLILKASSSHLVMKNNGDALYAASYFMGLSPSFARVFLAEDANLKQMSSDSCVVLIEKDTITVTVAK